MNEYNWSAIVLAILLEPPATKIFEYTITLFTIIILYYKLNSLQITLNTGINAYIHALHGNKILFMFVFMNVCIYICYMQRNTHPLHYYILIFAFSLCVHEFWSTNTYVYVYITTHTWTWNKYMYLFTNCLQTHQIYEFTLIHLCNTQTSHTYICIQKWESMLTYMTHTSMYVCMCTLGRWLHVGAPNNFLMLL